MKKSILYMAVAFSAMITQTKAQIILDTVAVGASYVNQKWYSLQNDEQGTQAKDNWDIGFEITGYSAAIIANTQKTNFAVYKAPYKIANYATVDTAGMKTWKVLQNKDTTWAVGAFNNGGVFADPNYLGWGVYDISTHIITGDSCYVVKLSSTVYKKLKIENLSGGIYNFTYANLDGTGSQTKAVNKTGYTGKNFAYFDMTANAEVDREPASANWDLTFVKYISFIPTAYPVTGVLQNKGVTVAQADNVASPATYDTYNLHTQGTAINTIGYDWKTFDLATNAWKITNDTVYFVKSKVGDMWKMRFTGFSGSADGKFAFSKEKLSSVGIKELNGEKIASLTVYPNPSTQDYVNVIYDLEKQFTQVSLKVYDITGHEIFNDDLRNVQGLYNYTLNTADFSKGIYLVNLYVDGKVVTQKIVKQ